MNSKKNPFEYGRELGKGELVNRHEELRILEKAIVEARKVFLIGPRRYGKTSLLATVQEKCRAEKQAVILRYNIEAFPTLEGLVKTIVKDAAQSLKGEFKTVVERVQKYFVNLKPELTFTISQNNPLQTDWKVGLGLASKTNAAGTEVELLVEALNGLENLAAEMKNKVPVALMLDEFQKAVEIGGTTTEAQIRSAVQTHRHVGYIFAGSKTRMMSEMTMNASRPFYRLGELVFVGEIPRAEFRQFLLSKFASGGFKVEGATGSQAEVGGAAEAILELAEDVPYNVQLLAHACWESLHASATEKKTATLTLDVINQSLERVVRRYDPFYTQLWSGLTQTQQRVLLAVIEENGIGMLSNNSARRIGAAVSTVQTAVRALLDKELIRTAETAGTLRYRFEDPFFKQWIVIFVNRM